MMIHEKSRTRSVDYAPTETGPVFTGRDLRNPSGFALLLSLLVIVVICGVIWLSPFALSRKNDDPDMPWNQESLLGSKSRPTDDQAQLTKDLWYTSKVKKDGNDRGKVMMTISTDGMIKGEWSGDYYQGPQIECLVIGAGFQGNIAPEKAYMDLDGQYPSKLYFITKGKFTILETRNDTGRVRNVSGYIYAIGWIDPDYSVTGNIIITSDRKDYHIFSWQAKPSEEPKLLFPVMK